MVKTIKELEEKAAGIDLFPDKTQKKIAAIICNHNDSRFLIDVIQRIAEQSPDELIIVNDRSTDRSMALLRCLQKHYDFKVVQNEGKHSPFGSFIAGCQATECEYVACFSADDYPEEDYLKRMRAAIGTFPLVEVYTCNTNVIREGMIYRRTLLPFTSFISPDYAVKIFQGGYAKNINQCGIIIKRNWVLHCWECVGKFVEVNFDCIYSFSSIFEKGFINLGEYLTTYRSYPNSFGAAGNNKKIKEASEKHKEWLRCRNTVAHEGSTLGNFSYQRSLASGIWGAKARWLGVIALWGIMKLPKWARRKFYNWFYSYNQGVEKL